MKVGDQSAGSVPSYRKHRPSGQAVVTLGGHDFYLGPYGSKASRLEYDRRIAEWLANGRQIALSSCDVDRLTVAELLARYWRFAQEHYRKDGKATSGLQAVRQSLKPLRRLYGHTLAREFGPLSLKAVRQTMIDAGLSRGVVNSRIRIVKRVFKWAVAEELVPPSVHHGLSAVSGLQKGRTEAPDRAPVQPVPDATVDLTLSRLPKTVADMIRFQRLVGCRPGEVCSLRPCDIDRSGEVWIYRPTSHKTEHHDRQRMIFIGPRAQTLVLPYLLRDSEAFCFSPADSEKCRRAEMRASRKTPVQPSQQNRRKRNPKRWPGGSYTRDSYRRAIAKACRKAGLPIWSPNQLRHTAGTEVRRRYGLEAAQVVLGHSKADITQVYAERDLELAKRIMKEVG